MPALTVEQQLKHIETLAQNARTTWFALLGLLVFVGVTLMSHKDSDFFAYGAATTLPLVGIDVPPFSFFIAAPILTSALFCYLHLYLLGLWDALGGVEQQIHADAPRLGERVYPMIFTIAALWYRNWCRGDCSMPHRVLGGWNVLIAIALGWGFGWLILALLWWRSMPRHEPFLTTVCAVSFVVALSVGVICLHAAHRRMRSISPAPIHRGIPFNIASLLVFFAIGIVSYERSGGPRITWFGTEGFGIPMASANLREAHLTVRPKDWLPFEEWLKEYRYTYARREGLPVNSDDWDQSAKDAFKTEARTRRAALLTSLDKLSLAGRDLRGASAVSAFLAGADLRRAQMEELNLSGAQMEGVNLRGASMNEANLTRAQLTGASLARAKIHDANLLGSNLEEANLFGVEMEDANLTQVTLVGGNLFGAKLSRSNFAGSHLDYADLTRAHLINADLSNARLEGAKLIRARLNGANLFGARLTEASLEKAYLIGANLNEARMNEADLSQAIMEKSNISRSRLNDADLSAVQLNNAYALGSQIKRANLRWARMNSAILSEANLSDSNLGGAQFIRAELRMTIFDRALVRSANFAGARSVDQNLLNAAFGDGGTVLPKGIVSPCHWDTNQIDVMRSVTYSLVSDNAYQAWIAGGAIPIPRKLDGTCPGDHHPGRP